jgi:hypothetical protein
MLGPSEDEATIRMSLGVKRDGALDLSLDINLD